MEIKGDYANASLALKQGIVIDTGSNSYFTFNKLFHLLKFKNASRPLPKVEYILLFRTLYNKCQSCSVQDFENSSTIQLSFVYNKNQKLIVHESNDIQYMMKLAKQLAAELKVRIRDGATDRRNAKWINLDSK